MGDLIERLREPCRRQDFDGKHCKQRNHDRKWWCAGCLGADALEAKDAEIERLREVEEAIRATMRAADGTAE